MRRLPLYSACFQNVPGTVPSAKEQTKNRYSPPLQVLSPVGFEICRRKAAPQNQEETRLPPRPPFVVGPQGAQSPTITPDVPCLSWQDRSQRLAWGLHVAGSLQYCKPMAPGVLFAFQNQLKKGVPSMLCEKAHRPQMVGNA